MDLSLNFHFLMTNELNYLFNIGHLDITICKVPVQVFCQFFCLVFFFNLQLYIYFEYELFMYVTCIFSWCVVTFFFFYQCLLINRNSVVVYVIKFINSFLYSEYFFFLFMKYLLTQYYGYLSMFSSRISIVLLIAFRFSVHLKASAYTWKI